VKKGPWSPEEDATLKSYIEQNGTGGNWIALPQKIGMCLSHNFHAHDVAMLPVTLVVTEGS
jgi:hypothetical protein